MYTSVLVTWFAHFETKTKPLYPLATNFWYSPDLIGKNNRLRYQIWKQFTAVCPSFENCEMKVIHIENKFGDSTYDMELNNISKNEKSNSHCKVMHVKWLLGQVTGQLEKVTKLISFTLTYFGIFKLKHFFHKIIYIEANCFFEVIRALIFLKL